MRFRRLKTRALLVVVLSLIPSFDAVQAQLFGPNLRQYSSRSQTGTSSLFGADLGIQESRGPGAFVGADPTDVQTFVGTGTQVTPGTVQAATEGLREDVVQNVNQSASALSVSGMYAPRLQIAFSPVAPPQTSLTLGMIDPAFSRRGGAASSLPPARLTLLTDPSLRLSQRLAKTVVRDGQNPIEVSVSERIATLTGAVASADDRSLAELVAQFEPGIDQVRNELLVQSPTTRTLE